MKLRIEQYGEAIMKQQIANMFNLPTAKYVNVQKAQAYLRGRFSPERRLEMFLDNISRKQRNW